MKKTLATWLGLMACAIASPALCAQPVPAVPVAEGVAVVAPTNNIWTMLFPSAAQRAACKVHWCRSPIGQLVGNMTLPLSMMSGGLVENRCTAALIKADLLLPADSAVGAAAAIKLDEAGAAARREAIRYLGTVDCRRWPEAEEALINGLRVDRNECVRLEAAYVLGRGCCCTKKTIEALAISASGSDKDKNPAEASERVRATAIMSLQNCLACYVDVQPVKAVEGEKKPGNGELPPPKEVIPRKITTSVEYYQEIDKLSKAEIIEHGKQALDTATTQPTVQAFAPRGSRGGLFEIVQHAFAPETQALPMGDQTVAPTIAAQPTNGVTVAQPALFSGPNGSIPVEMPVKQSGFLKGFRPAQTSDRNIIIIPADKHTVPAISSPTVDSTSHSSPKGVQLKTNDIDPLMNPLVTKPLAVDSTPPFSFNTLPPATSSAPKSSGTFATDKATLPPIPVAPVLPATLPAIPKTSSNSPVSPYTPVGVPAPVGNSKTSSSYAPMGQPAPVQPKTVTTTSYSPAPSLSQLLFYLREGASPEDRQRAATNLAYSQWSLYPEALQALTTASQNDASPAVRGTCLDCLSQLNIQKHRVYTR